MKQKLIILLGILLILASMAGCQPAETPQPTEPPTTGQAAPTSAEAAAPAAPTGEPLYIAVTGPMTGGGAQQGQYAMIGAEIAREEINSMGGINGRPVELIPMDDKGDPAEAATVAQRLVDDPRVEIVVGHMWSSATLAANPIYVEANMPVITPTASSVLVTTQGWENIIRICLRDRIQAPQMAALLVNNKDVKKVAVFYANDDYGRGLLDQGKMTIGQLGGEVVYEAPYKPNIDKDFTVQLEAAVNAGAEGILLGAQQAEAGLIVSQASQMGIFEDIPIIVGNAGMLYQLFLDRVDPQAEQHVWIAAPYDPFSERDVTTSFVAKFMEQEDSIPSETASYTYDALYIIKAAYEAGATRDTLIVKIKEMVFNDLVIGDNITFDKNGDRNDRSMITVTVENGRFASGKEAINTEGVQFAILDPEAEPFVIAVAGPMTGGGAQQGQYAMIGAEIARDEIHAAGGILGHPIELVPMDDKGDPAEAATVAQRLVDDPKIKVVVGHMWSSATLAAMPIYDAAGMPVITPTASNVTVTTLGYQNLIRVCLRDKIQGPQIAALLVNNRDVKNVAVFYANDDYGRGLLDQAKITIEELGGRVVYEAPYKPNIDKDFTVQLEAAVNAGADGILLGTQQAEGGLIISQASQMGIFEDIPVFVGNAGMLYQLFLDRVDTTSESRIWIGAPYDPFSERAVTQKFVAKFMEREDSIPSETASYTYDALHMIAKIINSGGTPETLVARIKATTFNNMMVGDNITFDQNGDRNDRAMIVVTVKDGRFVSANEDIDISGVTFDLPE